MWGFIFFLMLGTQPSFASSVTCESLFDTNTQIVDKLEQRYNKKYDNSLSAIIWHATPTLRAEDLGKNIIRLFHFSAEISKAMRTKKVSYTKADIEDFGDLFFQRVDEFLKESGINFSYKKRKIPSGTFRKYFVILTTGSHPLNVEALELKQKYGTEIVYDPYELLALDAGALYDERTNSLYVSEPILVSGSIFQDDDGKHELTHLSTKIKFDQKNDYLFYGFASIEKTALPGRYGSYDKSLNFDEMDAYFSSLDSAADMLTHLSTLNLSKGDLADLSTAYLRALHGHSDNGHLVSVRTYNIVTQSLKDLRKDPSPITFQKNKKGYYMAHWGEKRDEDFYYYTVNIPLFPQTENPTRAELVSQLYQKLQALQYASQYYRNLFKVAQTYFSKLKTAKTKEEFAEQIKLVQQFKKVLVRKYFFEKYSDIPTQQKIANSLSTDSN